MSDQEYVRHTLPIIFDVPAERARKYPDRLADLLNIMSGKIIDLIENDAELQSMLRRNNIDWGLSDASWEQQA